MSSLKQDATSGEPLPRGKATLDETPDRGPLTSEERAEWESVQRLRATGRTRRQISAANVTITSLMDAMTIVLVFLLQNFRAQSIQVTPSDDLAPARSTVSRGVTEMVPVYIMKSGIQVERVNEKNHLEMVHLVDVSREAKVFSVAPAEKEGGEAGYVIAKLRDELMKRIKLEEEKMAARGPVAGQVSIYERVLAVVADRDITGRLLMEVLYTATQAGYAKFKFVVVTPNVE